MKGQRPTAAEQDAMAAELGADSLRYLPLEAVARCIGLSADHLCRGCLTGKYPTATGEKLYQLALRNRNEASNGRTYEVSRASCVPTPGEEIVNGHTTEPVNGHTTEPIPPPLETTTSPQ